MSIVNLWLLLTPPVGVHRHCVFLMNVINEFLESKMKITSVKAAQARRLGRRNPHQSQATPKSRPILAIFQNINEKRAVIAKRAALAGTRVFLKDDLTKEQLQAERQLLNTRKKLLQHPNFQGKKITVYRNKLWPGEPCTHQ